MHSDHLIICSSVFSCYNNRGSVLLLTPTGVTGNIQLPWKTSSEVIIVQALFPC